MRCLLPGRRKHHLWKDSRTAHGCMHLRFKAAKGRLDMDLEKGQIVNGSHKAGLERFLSQEWPWVLKVVSAVGFLGSCLTFLCLILMNEHYLVLTYIIISNQQVWLNVASYWPFLSLLKTSFLCFDTYKMLIVTYFYTSMYCKYLGGF